MSGSQTIVAGVLGEATEKVGPCEVLDAVLFSGKGSSCDFGIQVVGYLGMQRRLNREGFIEELFVEVLFLFVDEDTSITVFIELGSASTADHLQEIC